MYKMCIDNNLILKTILDVCFFMHVTIHRGSYMRAHVLSNSLNELRKSDKMQACQAFYLFFFCNVFNKFNNTRARMLDSIYHMTFVLI